jgi:uncharacterized phage-associated protein
MKVTPTGEDFMVDSPSLTALDAAEYLISLVDHESGDSITHLKLQKLLYYAQGFHVAMRDGNPLFPESLLAWRLGPVVRRVYSEYSRCEHHSIDPKSEFRADAYAPEDREFLSAVYSTYGQFGATKLMNMTHEESPWIKTPSNRVITLDLLADYFTPLVQAGKRGRAVGGHPVWPTGSFRFQRRKELSRRMAIHRPMLKSIVRRGSVDD